jgi:hypothetical protein
MSRIPRLAPAVIALVASAPGALLPLSETFEVGGPAPDFATVAEAIASVLVHDGDVLLVHPGSGPDFTLDKALAIVAPAGQSFFAGAVSVQGVARFTLSGLHTRTLSIADVTGRGRLHAVEVGVFLDDGETGTYAQGSTLIEGCAELVASDCVFRGNDACYPVASTAGPAVEVRAARAAFAGCLFDGGKGAGEGCPEHYPTSGFGLGAFAGSAVTLAGCSVTGGSSPWDASSPALRVDGASSVSVRGSASDGLSATGPALTVAGDGTGHVAVSGVHLFPSELPPWVEEPVPAEPYVELAGSAAPGGVLSVDVFGPAGELVVLAGALAPALLEGLLPLSDPLWFKPSSVVYLKALVAAGQDTPASASLLLPPGPSFAGLGVIFQAAFVGGSGVPTALTNPDELVLAW